MSASMLLRRHGRPRWSPDARALARRMEAPPGAARLRRYDRLARTLRVGGVWRRLDALYVLAAHDAQAARLNLIGPRWDATVQGAPAFAVDQGYTGDGASGGLNTGLNPVTAAGLNYTLDAAHLGCWVTNEGTVNVSAIGNINARIFPRTTGDAISGRLNDAVPPAGPQVRTAIGHTILNRAGAEGYGFCRDGVVLSTASSAAGTMSDAPFYLCGTNGAPSPAFRLAAAHIGGALSAAEIATLHAALSAFLTT